MIEQIEQFLDHIALERGSPANTVAAYRNDLVQFAGFCRERVSAWDEVDPAAIAAYIAGLEAGHAYASSTVARKAAAVKSFFHWLAASGALPDDPTVTVDSPRVRKELPRAISQEQVEQLLARPGPGSVPQALRDRALLELLYATGLRVSELVALDVADVHAEETPGLLRVVRHRDGRERLVPISERAIGPLRAYLDHGRDQLLRGAAEPEPALFLNHRGRRLTRQGLWLIVKHYAREVGILGEVTPHILRHTLALHLLDQHADPEYVQEMLGYASLSTTPIFTGG